MKSQQHGDFIITINDDPLLYHLALFVREACSLVVPEVEWNPPRLIGDVIDLRDEVRSLDREVAGRQWLEWWANLLTLQDQLLCETDDSVVDREQLHHLTATHFGAFDGPRFDSLQSKPELMRAAQVAFPFALSWYSHFSKIASSRSHPSPIVGQIVQEINKLHKGQESNALERRAIDILVLAVEGSWTSMTRSGVICCSQNALSDKSWVCPHSS